MANKLSVGKKAAAVGMLCEGRSIRSVERITGIHRDTVMRLGVRIGEGCRQIMDDKMRDLALSEIDAANECVFQETGKLQSCRCASLRPLQFWRIELHNSFGNSAGQFARERRQGRNPDHRPRSFSRGMIS